MIREKEKQELIEEAIRRFPIGSTLKGPDGGDEFILSSHYFESAFLSNLGESFVYFNDEWATVVKYPDNTNSLKLSCGETAIAGSIVVSLNMMNSYRNKGDIFKVQKITDNGSLYYKTRRCSSSSSSFRMATKYEINLFNNGITNINTKPVVEKDEILKEAKRKYPPGTKHGGSNLDGVLSTSSRFTVEGDLYWNDDKSAIYSTGVAGAIYMSQYKGMEWAVREEDRTIQKDIKPKENTWTPERKEEIMATAKCWYPPGTRHNGSQGSTIPGNLDGSEETTVFEVIGDLYWCENIIYSANAKGAIYCRHNKKPWANVIDQKVHLERIEVNNDFVPLPYSSPTEEEIIALYTPPSLVIPGQKRIKIASIPIIKRVKKRRLNN